MTQPERAAAAYARGMIEADDLIRSTDRLIVDTQQLLDRTVSRLRASERQLEQSRRLLERVTLFERELKKRTNQNP
jgi:hypothetical protein